MKRGGMYGTTCSIEGCDKLHFSRGWCKAHHSRWVRHGDPEGGRQSNLRGRPPLDRLLARRTIDARGCWVISGGAGGYPKLLVEGVYQKAHRWSYEHYRGPIPDGLQLDHLCRNIACANPEHLEPVTQRENVLRGVGPTAINAAKTTCIHGHSLADAYINPSSGSRMCRACMEAS